MTIKYRTLRLFVFLESYDARESLHPVEGGAFTPTITVKIDTFNTHIYMYGKHFL